MSTESLSSSQQMKSEVVDHLDRRGKLSLWLATMAGQRLQHDNEAHIKNREAEERHVRKHVWGYKEPEPEDDDMGTQTILGDVQYPAPVVVAPQSRSLSPLLAAALGAALPGVGAAGYFANAILNQPTEPTPITESIDTTIEIGLGTAADLLDLPGP